MLLASRPPFVVKEAGQWNLLPLGLFSEPWDCRPLGDFFDVLLQVGGTDVMLGYKIEYGFVKVFLD